MLVLGLQGSPRKKGNTHYLLSAVLDAAEGLGARTLKLEVARRNIQPCESYTVCEKKGVCPIKDDMQREVYGKPQKQFLKCCGRDVVAREVELLAGAAGLRVR